MSGILSRLYDWIVSPSPKLAVIEKSSMPVYFDFDYRSSKPIIKDNNTKCDIQTQTDSNVENVGVVTEEKKQNAEDIFEPLGNANKKYMEPYTTVLPYSDIKICAPMKQAPCSKLSLPKSLNKPINLCSSLDPHFVFKFNNDNSSNSGDDL